MPSLALFFTIKQTKKGKPSCCIPSPVHPKEAFEKFGMPRNTHLFGATFRGDGVVRADDIIKDPRYGKNPPFSGMPAGHLPVVSYMAVPVFSKLGNRDRRIVLWSFAARQNLP